MTLLRFLRLWLTVLVLCIATPSLADDSADEADLLFQLGAEEYQAGNYQKALAHFLASNRLVPNRNVVFNVARTYEQLKRYPEAYRNYLLALDGEKDEAARKRVADAVARIAPSVAVLEIETTPPGATIYVERKDLGPRGTTPRALGFADGSYRIVLELDGYEPETLENVTLTLGKSTKLVRQLNPVLGELRIEGAPAGTVMRVDRPDAEPVSVAGTPLTLKPGRRKLYVSAPNFVPLEVDVEIRRKETTTLRPLFKRQEGTVVVLSDVPGSLVEIDGKAAGFTPQVISVPVGTHTIRVSNSGFRAVERKTTVVANQEQRISLDLLGFEEVSAVSRFAEQARDAPSSLSIIDGREIRAFGYPTLAEAVRGVRGLYLSDDRSYSSIGVRGASRPGDYGNKVLILYDGMSANDNILGQSFPGFEGLTDLDDVQRIEVVRGPGSSLYGTGAFFGVINVVRHDQKQESRAEATLSSADGAVRGRTLGYWGDGEKAAIWASGSVAYAAGRDFHFDEYQAEPSAGFSRDGDGFTAGMAQVRGFYDAFSAQAFFHQRAKGIPTGEYEVLFNDRRHVWTDRRGGVELKFEPQITDWLDSMTRLHGNLYNFEADLPYSAEDGGLATEDYIGAWAGLEQRFVAKPAEWARLTLGGEGQRHFLAQMGGEDSSGVYLPAEPNPYWVGSAYAEADFRVGDAVRLIGGARFDGFTWEFPEPLGDVARFNVNPRVSGVFRPYEAGTLKVLLGKAYKAPSVYELFYQSAVQVPSPELQPEEVYSAEIEHAHAFNKVLSVTGAIFVNYVTQLIVGRGDGTEEDPFHLVNSEAPIVAFGGELEARRAWKDGWMLVGSVSAQRSSYAGDNEGLREIPNSPALMASLKGVVPIVGEALQLGARATLESSRFDRNETTTDPRQLRSDASFMLDTVLSGRVLEGGVSYLLGVYNIADQEADVPVSGEFRQLFIPQTGRSFVASLTGRI